jgi:hypothetical protein
MNRLPAFRERCRESGRFLAGGPSFDADPLTFVSALFAPVDCGRKGDAKRRVRRDDPQRDPEQGPQPELKAKAAHVRIVPFGRF